jgi:hypothetical protein
MDSDSGKEEYYTYEGKEDKEDPPSQQSSI